MKGFRESLRVISADKKMASLIRKYGPPDLGRYHGGIGVFPALLRSIIYQQLSGHAARAIHARVLALFPKSVPTPQALLKIRAPKLRKAGLSIQKIQYVRDLAHKFLDGTIDEKRFPQMNSQEIIEHLTQVKGVGEWTAHMVLIFTLGRLDILPVGDLGIRKGFRKVYKMRTLPDKKEMEKRARPWREHASIASWYLWAVADDAKEKRKS
jgi:3-methyladenine DNA glycosylase/8-oxoguanine DNA glycosylase